MQCCFIVKISKEKSVQKVGTNRSENLQIIKKLTKNFDSVCQEYMVMPHLQEKGQD